MKSSVFVTAAVVVLLMGSIAMFVASRTASDAGPTGGDTRRPASAGTPLPRVSSSASSEASPSPSATDRVAPIETSSTSYFGRPYETVQIPGTYRGVEGATEFRVRVPARAHLAHLPTAGGHQC